MKLPSTDDLILFGSFFWFGVGAGIATARMTGDVALGIAVWMIAFSIPTALVTFLAAGEPE